MLAFSIVFALDLLLLLQKQRANRCANHPWNRMVSIKLCASKCVFDAAFAKPMCVASRLEMHAVRGGGQRRGKERRKRRKKEEKEKKREEKKGKG